MKKYNFLFVIALFLSIPNDVLSMYEDEQTELPENVVTLGRQGKGWKLVTQSLGRRILFRLKQPIAYVRGKLTGKTTPPLEDANGNDLSSLGIAGVGDPQEGRILAERGAIRVQGEIRFFKPYKSFQKLPTLSPEMEEQHALMQNCVVKVREQIKTVKEKLLVFEGLLKVVPRTQEAVEALKTSYESLKGSYKKFKYEIAEFDKQVSKNGDLLQLSQKYHNEFFKFENFMEFHKLTSYERLMSDLQLNPLSQEKLPVAVTDVAVVQENLQDLKSLQQSVKEYDANFSQVFSNLADALKKDDLSEVLKQQYNLDELVKTYEKLKKTQHLSDDHSLKIQELALDLEDSYQAYAKKMRIIQSYNIEDVPEIQKVFTLARQVIEQDQEVSTQPKSTALTHFFGLDHPTLVEDLTYSYQSRDDSRLSQHVRLHLPIEQLAELLLWESGSPDLQKTVRAKAESFLKSADFQMHPQVQKILTLYRHFSLLESQAADIVANLQGTNTVADKDQVVAEIQTFLQEIETSKFDSKWVFIKELKEQIQARLTDLGEVFFEPELGEEHTEPNDEQLQEHENGGVLVGSEVAQPDDDARSTISYASAQGGVQDADDDMSSVGSFVSALEGEGVAADDVRRIAEEEQENLDIVDALSPEMRAQVDLATSSINQLKAVAIKFSVHTSSIDSISLAQKGLSVIEAFTKALPENILKDPVLAEELNKVTVLLQEAIRVQKLAIITSLQKVYETFRSDFGKSIFPPATEALKQRIGGMLNFRSEEFVMKDASFNAFVEAVKMSLNNSLGSENLFLLLENEKNGLKDPVSYTDPAGDLHPVTWLYDQDRVIQDALRKYPKQGRLAAVQGLLPEFEQAYRVALFKSLIDEQKEDLKDHNQSLYFSLTTDVFEQQMKAYVRTVFGAEKFQFKDQTRVDNSQSNVDTFLVTIAQEKAACDAYLASLKESHNDELYQKMKAQLQPWYDELIRIQNHLENVKAHNEADTASWWKKTTIWFEDLITPKPIVKEPIETPVDQFLQNPITYLQDQSFEVRNQLRALQKKVNGVNLEQQFSFLDEQIKSGALSKSKAQKQFAVLKKSFELLLGPLKAYEELHDTYTFLATPGLLAFEKVDPKNPENTPLTNAAVIRFIATSLGIGIMDVFSMPRQELLKKVIATGKTTGNEMDPRYRDLSMVLSNDFVWAIELRKLEGNPVAIDHAKMEKQLSNFNESYPQFTLQREVEKIQSLPLMDHFIPSRSPDA